MTWKDRVRFPCERSDLVICYLQIKCLPLSQSSSKALSKKYLPTSHVNKTFFCPSEVQFQAEVINAAFKMKYTWSLLSPTHY